MKLKNLDEDQSAYFLRELEHTKAKAYDVKKRELKYRQFIPVSNEADPADESINYVQYDSVGMAKLISNYADDLPRADVVGKEFPVKVHGIGSSFGYSRQEIRRSAKTGRGLPQRKANSAARAIREEESRIAANGDDSAGILGFLNNPNIPATSVPNGASGFPDWAAKLASGTGAEEVLKDLNDAVLRIIGLTKEVEQPDTILLPPVQYALISTQRLPDSTTTILKFFLESNEYIQNVGSWQELVGAGAAGTDRMVTYMRDEDILTLEIPMEMEQGDVEVRGLEYITPVESRIGGVIVYYPLACDFADGI